MNVATRAPRTPAPHPGVPALRPGVRLGPTGWVLRPRVLVGTVGLALLALALVGYGVAAGGAHHLPADRLLPILLGQGDTIEQIVMDKRLPRVVLGVCFGFALGAAGAITQSITRNPLASPDIVGVTSGASLAAVLVLVGAGGRLGVVGLTGAALAGGLVAAAVVLAFGWRGGLSGLRIILAGIAVSTGCSAAITWMLMRTDLDTAEMATRWLTGTLGLANPGDMAVAVPVGLASVLVLALTSRQVATLRLSPDTARSLGVDVTRARAVQMLVAVVLTATATAVCGPIGFVGFVAPQLAMRVLRTAGPPVLGGGLLGAVVVLAADRLVQSLPVTLPVGSVTATLGAPVLIWLVVRRARRADA